MAYSEDYDQDYEREDNDGPVELCGEIEHTTDRAVLFIPDRASVPTNASEQVWIPKSLVLSSYASRDQTVINVPEWFAIDKGLI